MDTTEDFRTRVLLLIGGVSGEHSISLLTAASVLRAIDHERYDVRVVGISPAGTWGLLPTDPEPLDGGRAQVSCDLPAVSLARIGDATHLVGADGTDHGVIDVCFPLLHGPFGEDGTIQGMCEMLSLRYVGAGVLASAAGMDKHYTKVLLGAAGLPVGNYVAVSKRRWQEERDQVDAELAALRYPLFVKPARAGSSLGITRVATANELDAAVENAQLHDPKVIIEQGCAGREIEIAVLQRADGTVAAAPAGEVVMDLPDDEFYDWETKYFSHDRVSMQCPADLPPAAAKALREAAITAFHALYCEGLVRVDFFYAAGQFIINEVNTMPGMTPYSLYPYMWQQAGLSYTELLTELIEQARSRPLTLR